MKNFYTFCTQYTIGTPFPVTEMLLCSFAVHLAEQGLAPQTIKRYLSAVRNTQLSLGLPDPREKSSLPVLKRVQAGIQRVRATKGPPSQLRLPITAAVLEQIGAHMRQSNLPQKDMLWAVCCTAFFGFFRLGELLPVSQASISLSTSLMWGDIAVDSLENPTMVRVHLKRSKCDQFGKGADIILGKTGLSLCPVTAILKYVEIRVILQVHFSATRSHIQSRRLGLWSGSGMYCQRLVSHPNSMPVIAFELVQPQQLLFPEWRTRPSRLLAVGTVQHSCNTLECPARDWLVSHRCLLGA